MEYVWFSTLPVGQSGSITPASHLVLAASLLSSDLSPGVACPRVCTRARLSLPPSQVESCQWREPSFSWELSHRGEEEERRPLCLSARRTFLPATLPTNRRGMSFGHVPKVRQLGHVIELVRLSWDLRGAYRACRCIFPFPLISL